MEHYARMCREKNQSGYNTKNNKRHLNYIGIHSSERSRILDDESSSDEDEEKRFYPISTRSQKYGNAGTNTRRNKTDNFQQRKMDKLAENDKRRLNSESRRELELLDEDSEDEVMANTGNKRMDAIKKALEGKRKKNKCKRCGRIGHFVPDCLTLTEGEKKWYGEERQQNKEKRKEKLGYEIEEPSNIIIKSANDQKERSLGIIKRVEILLEGEEITMDMEVIENSNELLILGNDWIKRNVKNIDIDNGEMRIKGKYGIQVIPIEFTKEIDDKEEEYESEEDMREVYC